MPKFITYQRPAPVNKAKWGGIKGPPQLGRKAPKALADKSLPGPPTREAPKPK
jgi:hypothetical protein